MSAGEKRIIGRDQSGMARLRRALGGSAIRHLRTLYGSFLMGQTIMSFQ